MCSGTEQRTSREGHPRDPVREQHRDGAREMGPGPEVVARPHRAKSLRARKEGAGEDKRPFRRVLALDETLRGEILLQTGQLLA